MNIFTAYISIISIVLYSGCAQYEAPKPDKKKEISILNQKVKELDANDKKLIYRSIQNDINRYSKEADKAYSRGYNNDALIAYKLVNFYEGYHSVPLQKIEKIKKNINYKSRVHYKRALKQYMVNNKKALYELNIVMMNNPNYKYSSELFDKLHENRDIKIYVNSIKSSLQMQMLNSDGKIKSLKSIELTLKELLAYDYKNILAAKAEEVLQKHMDIIAENNLLKYKRESIKIAKQAFLEKEYVKSIEYAQKVIAIDAKCMEASNILKLAKQESKIELDNLIKSGICYYDDRKLDEAMNNFQSALKIDPYSNASLIYSKKIHRQLKTIKSLQ
ncbi:MAG: hypothetical protein COB99_07770 [Sulfurimonas sp.]|nr:MAG: hypothetical protein COB99_07770 [Sulfurimonas sp.]